MDNRRDTALKLLRGFHKSNSNFTGDMFELSKTVLSNAMKKEKLEKTRKRKPQTWAAGAIYYSSALKGDVIPQKVLCDMMGISRNTIRMTYNYIAKQNKDYI